MPIRRRWLFKLVGAGLLAWICATVMSGPVSAHFATSQLSPPSPKNLQAAPGGDHVGLTWDAAAGATSYTIYRALTHGTETLYLKGIKVNSFANTKVDQGITYYYQVSAVNDSGESALSNEAAASTTAAASLATPTPHPVAHASGGGVSFGKIVLWLILGLLSLGLIGGGVLLFLRQRRESEQHNLPGTVIDSSTSPVPVVSQKMPTAKGQFAPRSWDELSSAERTGVTGIFKAEEQMEPLPPAQRELGAVAFWDEQAENAPPPANDPNKRHFSYPDRPVWPPDRGTMPMNQDPQSRQDR